MNTVKPAKSRGRPAAFNHDDALDKAMHTFWQFGYEGASLALLTEAMGINKPSMYGAFGDKEQLFRKALQKYLSGPASFAALSLKEPTAKRITETLLTQAAEFLTSEQHPTGCMLIQSALSCGESATQIKAELATIRLVFESKLSARFEECRLAGDLPDHMDVKALAKYVTTLHQGMSVQASSGASKAELMQVVNHVLQQWPSQ